VFFFLLYHEAGDHAIVFVEDLRIISEIETQGNTRLGFGILQQSGTIHPSTFRSGGILVKFYDK
jgi:hypothetical protein